MLLRSILIALALVLGALAPSAHAEEATAPAVVVAPEMPAGYWTARIVEESLASRQCSASCPCTARVWQDAISPRSEPTVRIWASDCKAAQVIPDAWVLYRASVVFPGATIKPYQPSTL